MANLPFTARITRTLESGEDVEVTVRYHMAPPEHDVGIMGWSVDDYLATYTDDAGTHQVELTDSELDTISEDFLSNER